MALSSVCLSFHVESVWILSRVFIHGMPHNGIAETSCSHFFGQTVVLISKRQSLIVQSNFCKVINIEITGLCFFRKKKGERNGKK